ncbi:MAG: hypothetical protein JWO82_2591 [Akkermansiaceae bacterium]|nr:hypothetical protein [Akkermansiaceae bacterium]
MRPGFDPRSPGRNGGGRRSSSSGRLPELRTVKKFVVISLSVLALVALVSVSVWLLRGQKNAPNSRNSSADTASGFIGDLGSDGANDSAPPPEKKLVKIATEMVEATRPTDLPDIVRLAGRKPEALLAKLQEMAKDDGEVSNVSYIGPVQNLTQPLEAVLVSFRNKRNRIALFCPDKQGQWLIDFDSYSRSTSTPWNELLSGGNAEATVRVYVSMDSYYNGRFSEESEWSCNGLASPDQPTLMFGYTPKNSPVDRAIRESLRFKLNSGLAESSRMLRMTLGIKHQEGDDKRQFEIVRVIADDWATPARALDERY